MRKIFSNFINKSLYENEVKNSHLFNPKEFVSNRNGPIFIIGAPRSGSTLLYQLLISKYNFSFFTNLHEKFKNNPAFAEKIITFLPLRRKSNFKSTYGNVKGILSPSEAGEYWYRFFPRSPQYTNLSGIEMDKAIEMQQSIDKLQNQTKKPLIIKNLPIAVRLEPVVKYFPNSIFIIINRDIEDNAHSILRGRYKYLNRYDKWWSVEPKNKKELEELAPHIQVVEQIKAIKNHIEIARKDNPDSFYFLNYENLCNSPHRELKQIKDFIEKHKIPLVINKSAFIPDRFEIKSLPVKKFISPIKDYLEKS